MRRKVIFYPLILTVLLSLVSFSVLGVDSDDLVERDGLYYKKFSDVPFTGKVTGEEQGSFRNGKREGEWVWYHENGQLSRKITYKC
jgi:antitoxin component YwqK of YwqJK toxin-antitoxin module